MNQNQTEGAYQECSNSPLAEFALKHGIMRCGQLWRRRVSTMTASGCRIHSLTMEADFWLAIEAIAFNEGKSSSYIISRMYERKQTGVSIASALKFFVFSYFTEMHLNAEEMAVAKQMACAKIGPRLLDIFGHLLYIICARENTTVDQIALEIKQRSKQRCTYHSVCCFCLQYMIALISPEVIIDYLLANLVLKEILNDKTKTGHNLIVIKEYC